MTQLSRTHVATRRNVPPFDLILVIATLLVSIIGVVMVYTATRGSLLAQGEDPKTFLKKQGLFVVLGFIVMVVVALIDYRRLEPIANILYWLIILSLLGVFAVGSSAQGAARWFSLGPLQLQPSEFAVLALILAVSAYRARREADGLAWRDVFRLLVMAAIPIALVLLQPDLGTAMIMIIVTLVLLAVAGLPIRILVMLLVGTALFAVVAVESGLLHHYQIARLTTFLNPNSHSTNPYVQSAIYNEDQAKNAIGSGGVFGSGIGHGVETNLGYVPEQQTDFIFTAVAEQLGFVGSVFVLALEGVIVVAGAARRRGGPGHVRPTDLQRPLRLHRVQRLPERRDDDGDHADHGYPAPVRELRRDGRAGVLRRRGPGPERRSPQEIPMTDVQPEAEAEPEVEAAVQPDPLPAPAPERPRPSFPAFRVMDVEDVSMDLPSPYPSVTLVESEPPMRSLVFPVGLPEGTAMAQALRRMDSRRPMTHELFMHVMQQARIDVIALRLVGRDEGNLLAELDLMTPAGRVRVDCRPSDGIVLALRMPVPAPILVDERLLEEAGDVVPVTDDVTESDEPTRP